MRSQTLPLAPELMTRVVGACEGRIISTDLIRRAATDGDSRPHFGVLRRRLYEDASNRTYRFAEPRVGYRMPKGETTGPETGP